MKWFSIIGVFTFAAGLAMVLTGQAANGMKAENREGLILYGLLFCFLSVVLLAVLGITLLVRQSEDANAQQEPTSQSDNP